MGDAKWGVTCYFVFEGADFECIPKIRFLNFPLEMKKSKILKFEKIENPKIQDFRKIKFRVPIGIAQIGLDLFYF